MNEYSACNLSTRNEPGNDLIIKSNFRQYPDMKIIYETFIKKMEVQRKLVIGGGFETTMKNILLAIQPKSMFWFKPAWNHIDVYCEQFEIKKINSDFKYLSKHFYTSDFQSAELLYQTIYSGPFFQHNEIDIDKLRKNYRYVILDVSYCDINQIKKYLNVSFDNVITIGSFDKLFGCGLRFGFCTYPDKLDYRIQICRERCINSAAADFILSHEFVNLGNNYKMIIFNKFKRKIISLTNNFIVVKRRNNINLLSDHKDFSVGKTEFVRFGIPSNDNEYNILCKDFENI